MSKNVEESIIYEIPGANLREVIVVAFNIFDKTWLDPFNLMLPDKKVIPWHRHLAAMYLKNEITEEAYIHQSKKEG